MGRLKGRIVRLEGLEQAAEEGLTATQRHCRWAFARATREEQEALRRLLADGENLPLWKLGERVLRREAPTLANDVRAHRDLLYRRLRELEGEYQGSAYSRVVTARVNRSTAISRGVEPLEDAQEVHSIVELITAPETSLGEVLELVRANPGGEQQ